MYRTFYTLVYTYIQDIEVLTRKVDIFLHNWNEGKISGQNFIMIIFKKTLHTNEVIPFF